MPVIGNSYPLRDNVKEYPLRNGLQAGMVVKVLFHHGNSFYDVIATDGTEGTVYSVNLETGSYHTNDSFRIHSRYSSNYMQSKAKRGQVDPNAGKWARELPKPETPLVPGMKWDRSKG